MANDNHLLSATCYNATMLNNKYYNEFIELGQQKINFKFYEWKFNEYYLQISSFFDPFL